MLLRSLKLVNFRGIPELQVRDLRESGVHPVALPAGVAPECVSEAARFALFGRTRDAAPVLSEGAGYAWVEVAFRTASDASASMFRGVDRRGAWQVSIREDGGMRITSGPDDVRARLEEILGLPADEAERVLFPPFREDPRELLSAPAAPPAPGPDAPSAMEIAGARDSLSVALDRLRRAGRMRQLVTAAESEHEELAVLGARLRRERLDCVAAVERVVADRERVRVRLRRVNEYRDQLSSLRAAEAAVPAAAAPRRRSPSPLIELTLGVCAAGLLAVLVYPGWSDVVRRDPVGRSVAGLGFVVACGSYLWVASRRHGPSRFVGSVSPVPAAPPAPDAAARRAALRARFSDIGEPDDPNLVDDLRSRISALDEQAAPLQARLERIDDAISLADVEIGRTARALHRQVPPREDPETGLAPGESIEDAATRVANLGDSVHQACVERDALAASGVPEPGEAVREVETSFRRLAALAGDEAAGPAVIARADAAGGTADDISLRLHQAADELASLAAARGEVTMPVASAPAPAGGAADLPPGAWLAVTGGRFDRARRGDGGRFELLTPGTEVSVAWDALPADVRDRAGLAIRLRQGESVARAAGSLASPRVAVLDTWPEGFAAEEELARFVAEHAPGVTQILAGRSDAAAGNSDVTVPLRPSDVTRRGVPRKR